MQLLRDKVHKQLVVRLAGYRDHREGPLGETERKRNIANCHLERDLNVGRLGIKTGRECCPILEESFVPTATGEVFSRKRNFPSLLLLAFPSRS